MGVEGRLCASKPALAMTCRCGAFLQTSPICPVGSLGFWRLQSTAKPPSHPDWLLGRGNHAPNLPLPRYRPSSTSHPEASGRAQDQVPSRVNCTCPHVLAFLQSAMESHHPCQTHRPRSCAVSSLSICMTLEGGCRASCVAILA